MSAPPNPVSPAATPPGLLHSESSDEVSHAIDEIEKRVDECHLALKLLNYPWNQAIWEIMTVVVFELETARQQLGSPYNRYFLNALSVLGRVAAIAINWIRDADRARAVAHRKFVSNPTIEQAAIDARNMARSYQACEACFPAWHEDLFRAVLLSSDRVRFNNVRESEGDRRVSAWHKGIRPEDQVQEAAGAGPIVPCADLDRLLDETLLRVNPAGRLAVNYKPVAGAWEQLSAEYEKRLDEQFRRTPEMSLGTYTLQEFKRFYAALMALCAIHDFVHTSWATKIKAYPYVSAVIVRSRNRLTNEMEALTGLPLESVRQMISDLTFRNRRYDLHIHPFVPVAEEERLLAIIPHFAMASNPEENILRMVTHLRPDIHEITTRTKEGEAIADLIHDLPAHFVAHENVALTKGNPDIDLLLEHPESSTLLIAELKWIRPPWSIKDRIGGDQQIRKASNQLSVIRQFLQANPDYLTKAKPVLRQAFSTYRSVYYVLVARGYFSWPETGEAPVIEHGVLKRALANASDLNLVIDDLLKYTWLPIEGRDFTVQYDEVACNGVFVQLDAYLPTGRNAQNAFGPVK
jgi:hypothetical protein